MKKELDLKMVGNMLHISPRVNRESILANGLMPGLKASGYGKQPEHCAVYLFALENINVIYEIMNVFNEFDIWTVDVDCLNPVLFIPDEDSGKETVHESLETYGTLAYKGTIDKSFVNLFLEVKVPKQFSDEWE